MKILQINSVCGVGSTGRIATDLYKVLEEQGHECKIAYGRGTAPEGIDSIKIGSNLDNYTHVFKTRVFDKHGFGSVNATKKFIEEVKEYDPDIIHLHNIHGYYINIELLFNYLKESNKPVVWTLHDCWAFTGHCSHFDYVGCDKWKSGCNNCIQKEEYPSSYIIDNSKINYERKKALFTSIENMTIVAPSRWLSNLVNKSFLGIYKVNVVNNGIDLEKFKPIKSNFKEKYNLQNKCVILGVASTWTEKKGLSYFNEIESQLDDSYKVVMVGVSKKQERLLDKNIICINATDSQIELAEIYTASDIFVNTTLEEVMGLVNVEAMACGTPVITFDTGGSPECVEGLEFSVVKKQDINQLIDRIKQIYGMNQGELSVLCRNKVCDKYDKNIKFKEYIDIYCSLL